MPEDAGGDVPQDEETRAEVIEAAICRGVAGALAGAVIGYLVACWLNVYHDVVVPGWVAAGVGAVACSLLALLVGKAKLSGAVRAAAIGGITGILIGGLVLGVLVYPRIMMPQGYRDPNMAPLEKLYSGYQFEGFLGGAFGGLVSGMVAGLAYHKWNRRRAPKG